MRARWFGAGALSVAMMVAVYEGGVRVASASQHGGALALAPGQAATVDGHGRLARAPHPDERAQAEAATGAAAQGPTTADDRSQPSHLAADAGGVVAQAEVARLRALLQRNGISPDNGERLAGQRRGLDDDGDTDLTPDEWRALAARGELRYRLPGGRSGDAVNDDRARRLSIPEADRAEVNQVFARGQQRLMETLRGLYREAAGGDPSTLSMEALTNEIRDKTPDDVLHRVNYQLSQERGAALPWQAPRADMPPYERMMRALITYEGDLERALAPVVGERIAHDILHGENAVSAHAFGLTSRPAPQGAR